jgi:hypothetical protein
MAKRWHIWVGLCTVLLAVHIHMVVHVDGHGQRIQNMLQDVIHALPHPHDVEVHPVIVHAVGPHPRDRVDNVTFAHVFALNIVDFFQQRGAPVL